VENRWEISSVIPPDSRPARASAANRSNSRVSAAGSRLAVDDRLAVVDSGQVADADGLARGQARAQVVLEDGRRTGPPRGRIDGGQVGPVDQDHALAGQVQAGEKLGQRRLARAVLADDRDRRTRRQVQVQALEDRFVRTRVAEADPVQADAGPQPVRRGAARRGS
jgi:hypothetical protein